MTRKLAQRLTRANAMKLSGPNQFALGAILMVIALSVVIIGVAGW